MFFVGTEWYIFFKDFLKNKNEEHLFEMRNVVILLV